MRSTYDLIQVKYSGFVPHDTTKFMYDFKVAKVWLENNSIPRNAVALHAYDRVLDVWEVLPTEVRSDDDEFVHFSSADDEGVHYLFIGKMIEGYDGSMTEEVEAVEAVAEEKTEETPTTPSEPVEMSSEVETVDLTQPTPVTAPAPAPQPVLIDQPVTDSSEPTSDSRLVGALILIALAIIVVVLYLVFGRKKLGYSVDKELDSYVVTTASFAITCFFHEALRRRLRHAVCLSNSGCDYLQCRNLRRV